MCDVVEGLVLGIKPELELWEAVSAIQVMQAAGIRRASVTRCTMGREQADLFRLWGIDWTDSPANSRELAFNAAYRAVEASDQPYPAVLASESGFGRLAVKAPRLAAPPEVSDSRMVLVCPGEVHGTMALPWQVWKAVVRHMRTYGLPVGLLARTGQRADYAGFTEGVVFSGLAMKHRLEVLARASLVVGVPNEWTWLATGMNKKVALLYPDTLPSQRWLGWETEAATLGRVLYTPTALQVPVILAGLRRLIQML